jgi:hypothetical protein
MPAASWTSSAQGPERDAAPVREAAAGEHPGLRGQAGACLAGEPRLADAGIPDDRDHARRPRVARLGEGVEDRGQLGVAADQRGAGVGAARLAQGHEAVGGHRVGLALEGQRRELLGDHVPADEALGELADQDLAVAGRLLEPRRDVDGVAGDQPLPGGRVARHDLAGVDAGAVGQPDAGARLEVDVELAERVAHRHGGADRAQRVVLVQRGQPEHGHHRVADELLHGAAVTLDRVLHRIEVAADHLPHRLGVEPVAEVGRADEIAEHDRDRLADLGGTTGGVEGGAAEPAEPEAVGVLLAAVGAADHDRSGPFVPQPLGRVEGGGPRACAARTAAGPR